MKTLIGLLLATFILLLPVMAQEGDEEMAVRGFCIAAPQADEVDAFTNFIHSTLAPMGVNVLVLRVDYNYSYKSHPELRDSFPLSKEDVENLNEVCGDLGIEIIPQINLLGHQSWHSNLSKLLEVYPEFDETPSITLPDSYEWPNEDGLYCKSYCPLHPEVHEVVFALIDEIMDVFDAQAFHAGMDEVFYIGHEDCERCYGRDKAELFAGEVTKIYNHLSDQGYALWIWGDRLIDGKTTGIGMWEASMNNTHRAVDMIPKDVVICDWHYERAEPTAAFFATKGFRVVTCPWRKAAVAKDQYHAYQAFKRNSNPALASRYLGMMQTVWTSPQNFMSAYESPDSTSESLQGMVNCFKTLFELINE